MTADPIRDYLKAIGSIPLLTRLEETQLAQQVLAMSEVLNKERYAAFDRNSLLSLNHIALTPDDRTIIRQGQQAKERMIKSNLRLVVAIAKKYQGRGLDFLDLIQEGSFGLDRAVEKFDVRKGYKFSTYAYWWITQSLTRSLSVYSRSIRLPQHIIEKLNLCKKFTKSHQRKFNRSPTLVEMAAAVGTPVSDLRHILEVSLGTSSLNHRLKDGETELGDLVAAAEQPLDEIDVDVDVNAHQLLDRLPPREQHVIRLRFGLDDGEEKSLANIGTTMNISRERVRQIQTKAMRSMRREVGATQRS